MRLDDPIIVIDGGADRGSSEVPPPGPRAPPLGALAPIVAVFLAVVALVAFPQERGRTEVEPTDLRPPDEPVEQGPAPIAESDPDTATAELPGLATGWKEVDLLGVGSSMAGVAHGAAGWLAVSAGAPMIAHISDQATLWEPRTIHGVAGQDPHAAVGDGVMAIVASNPAGVPGATAAVSDDQGRTWMPVQMPGSGRIDDVAVVGDLVFAVGRVGGSPEPDGSPGSATAWVIEGSVATMLDLGSSEGSGAAALLPSPDGSVMVLGHDAGAPAAWRIGADASTERLPLTVPDGAPPRGFIDAAAVDQGIVAVTGVIGEEGGDGLWFSLEGVNWVQPYDADAPYLLSIESYSSGLLGHVLAQPSLWSNTEGMLRRQYSVGITGREGMFKVTDVATDGERIAISGEGEEGAMLLVRGTATDPVELRPRLPRTQPSWLEVSRVALDTGATADTAIASGTFEGTRFLLLEGVVASITPDGDVRVEVELSAGWGAGIGPDGLWVAGSGESGSTVHTFDGSRWATEAIPLQFVTSIAELGGRTLAWGYGPDGPATAEKAGQGGWTETETAGNLAAVIPVDSGILVPSTNAEGMPIVHFSEDAETWTIIDEGRMLHGPRVLGGVPFLRDPAEPRSITLLDVWPEVDEVEVPTPVAAAVRRWEGGLIVEAPGYMYISDAGGSWSEYPLDLEHGLDGVAAVLPGPVPTVATVDDGVVRLSIWDEIRGERPLALLGFGPRTLGVVRAPR